MLCVAKSFMIGFRCVGFEGICGENLWALSV